MYVDFKDAATRHFRDAEYLFGDGRLENAGQPYGYCAECGVKALLVVFGLPQDPQSGDLIRKTPFRQHINGLLANLQTFIPSDRGFYSYMAMLPGISEFQDWTTEYRYYAASAIPAKCLRWRVASAEIRRMMDQAIVDGRM